MCNECNTDDYDLENGILMPPVPREKRRTVVSVSFNADEMDKLLEMRNDVSSLIKLTTFIKNRLFAEGTPTVTFSPDTYAATAKGVFRITDAAGKVLTTWKLE